MGRAGEKGEVEGRWGRWRGKEKVAEGGGRRKRVIRSCGELNRS